MEVADQTFYLTQSQYTDIGPTSPSADPIVPGTWQGSHWSANFEVTGMTRPGKTPSQAGFEPRIFCSRGRRLNHEVGEVVTKCRLLTTRTGEWWWCHESNDVWACKLDCHWKWENWSLAFRWKLENWFLALRCFPSSASSTCRLEIVSHWWRAAVEPMLRLKCCNRLTDEVMESQLIQGLDATCVAFQPVPQHFGSLLQHPDPGMKLKVSL